jgi:hypothetical protein
VENRSHWTFGNTSLTVDAFVWMDKQNGFTFVEAFHGTDNNAVRVFAVEARFSNNMSHGTPFQARKTGNPFFEVSDFDASDQNNKPCSEFRRFMTSFPAFSRLAGPGKSDKEN